MATISFTIDGITYTAEEGMLWMEWCASDYNTDGFICAGENQSVYTADGSKYVQAPDGYVEEGMRTITEGLAYTLVAEAEASLISFTIDGIAYTAEEGMLWMEWCASDYNTGTWTCTENNPVTDADGNKIYNDSILVEGGFVIESGAAYTIKSVAKTIIKYGGADLATLFSGQTVTMACQNKLMIADVSVEMIGEGSGGTSTDTSDATTTADEVIKGETFYGADGKKTGTMPSVTENTPTLTLEGDGNGNVDIKHLQMINTYLPAGETEIGTVAVENLTPDHIIKGVTILGVTGEYESEEPNLISKTITENGTYKASEDIGDGIVGTWLLNDTVNPVDGIYKIPFAENTVRIWSDGHCDVTIGDGQLLYLGTVTHSGTGTSYVWAFVDAETSSQIYPAVQYNKSYDSWAAWAYDGGGFAFSGNVYISFNANPTDNLHADVLLEWLKANGTKVSGGTVDGYSEVIVNVEQGIDTSDATATADKILLNETAYVNGEKVTGSIETYDNIIGTWVLNPSLSYHTEQVTFLINAYSHINPNIIFGKIGLRINGYAFCGANANGSNYYLAYYDTNSNPTYSGSYVWFREVASASAPFQALEANETNRTITITGGEDVSNKILVDWFKANATRKSDILMTSPNGIILDTEGKYVDKDIAIVPTLEEKTVKSTTEKQVISTSNGYVGVSNITVDPIILMSKTVIKNGTYKARNEGADELQGIWMFKSDKITIPVSSSSPITYNVNFTTLDGRYTADSIRLVHTGEPYYVALAYELHFCGGNLGDDIVYKARYSDANGMWLAPNWRTIVITSIFEEVTNGSALLAWLQTNATKLPVDGYSEVKVSIAEWDGSGVVIEEIATEEPEDDSIVGTWVFNDQPSTEYMANWFSVEFTSNNENFIAISDKQSQTSSNHNGILKYFKTATSYVTVINGGTEEWIEAYKTITILTEPTDEAFITWLKANATKQGASETKHQLAIECDGTIYRWDVDSTSELWMSLNGKYDTTNKYYIYCPYASSIVELYTDSAGSEAFTVSDADASQYGDYGYYVSETYYAFGNDLGGSN